MALWHGAGTIGLESPHSAAACLGEKQQMQKAMSCRVKVQVDFNWTALARY